ncbi:chymotrypsin inhibitor SCI-III-like [Trichoplusia ni]|uniref:Chymotrypsin inhibitor SCI-III-like n=1 Tax=Trichoplusia ni TaxID=7111 RepID=A0A7E5WNF2_TRINI|nr:chymotrypsin inhibitor SCI-III-like [Trichoplusia ni]
MSDSISIILSLIVIFSICRAIQEIELESEEDDDDNICDLPIDEGDCYSDSLSDSDEDMNGTTVYGYNRNTTKCEEFIYEGCDGNKNRFDNTNECWKTCYTPIKYFLARVTQLLSAQ